MCIEKLRLFLSERNFKTKLNFMDNSSPHQYLKELKQLIISEKEEVNQLRNASAKSQEYEMAKLYRNIEAKLINFLEDLEFKKPFYICDN